MESLPQPPQCHSVAVIAAEVCQALLLLEVELLVLLLVVEVVMVVVEVAGGGKKVLKEWVGHLIVNPHTLLPKPQKVWGKTCLHPPKLTPFQGNVPQGGAESGDPSCGW